LRHVQGLALNMSRRYRQSVTPAPTLQLLEWIRESERTYADTVDVWHSHCPRLTVWEDAIADELVRGA
jgi:hypothetical protein